MALAPSGLSFGGLDSRIAGFLRAGLSSPLADLQRFTDRVRSFTSPLSALTQGLNPMQRVAPNPYTVNAFQTLTARADSVLACDWVAVVQSTNKEIGWEYIDKISTPALNIGTQEHMNNAVPIKTAGPRTVGEVTLTLYTDINATSINWAQAWMRSTHRTDGYFNLPAQYKRTIILYLLDARNRTVIDFRFVGCFPTALNSYDLGSDSSLLETTLTVSVDDVLISAENDLSAASMKIGQLFPLGT